MKKVDTLPQEDKFKEMFEMTLESDHDYFGSLENINFFGLICTAAQGDFMRKIFNNDIVMFNTEYEDENNYYIEKYERLKRQNVYRNTNQNIYGNKKWNNNFFNYSDTNLDI